MSQKPLVSVLIPAYNHQQYVQQTLDSVLEDDFESKEIVIIDDGSSDDTDHLIRRWIDQHQHEIPIVYRSRPNQGLTKTLNELLQMSRGEYLVAIASDDFLLPGGLQKRVAYLEKHLEKYAVFTDCIVVDEAGRKISESAQFDYRHASRENFQTDAGIRREFLTNFAMPGPVLMVRRDFYKAFGGFNEEMYMEDYDLYLRFAAKGWIGFLDAKVSAYRVHGGNMSASDSAQYLRLLEESRKTLLLHQKSFMGYERYLLYRQVVKFTLRIAMQRAKDYFTRR